MPEFTLYKYAQVDVLLDGKAVQRHVRVEQTMIAARDLLEATARVQFRGIRWRLVQTAGGVL